MMAPRRLRAVAGHLRFAEAAAAATEGDDTELAASTAEFRSQGVAVVPGLVDPSALEGLRRQCQQAVASSTGAAADEAAPGWCSPGYIDSPELLEASGAECLKVMQNPRLLGLLQAAVGADAHLVNIQAAAVGGASAAPPAGPELRREYGRDDGIGGLKQASFLHPVLSEAAMVSRMTSPRFSLVFSLVIAHFCSLLGGGGQVFIALSDQQDLPDLVAYIPGTNRLPGAKPPSSTDRQRWTARAGDALVMDAKTWHAALLPAFAGRGASLVMYYQTFNKKAMVGVAEAAARLDAARRLSPLGRQVLGLHTEGFAGNHMQAGNIIAIAPPVSLQQSGAGLIHQFTRKLPLRQ